MLKFYGGDLASTWIANNQSAYRGIQLHVKY